MYGTRSIQRQATQDLRPGRDAAAKVRRFRAMMCSFGHFRGISVFVSPSAQRRSLFWASSVSRLVDCLGMFVGRYGCTVYAARNTAGAHISVHGMQIDRFDQQLQCTCKFWALVFPSGRECCVTDRFCIAVEA